MSDIFDEDAEIVEEVPTEKVEPERSNTPAWEDDGTRPAMATAKIFESILAQSAKLHNKQHELDALKLARQAEFLNYANSNGFSSKEIVTLLKDAINLAKDKKDTRALARLVELVGKTMFEPANDMSKFFLQLQQNNFKMTAKGGDKTLEDATTLLNSLPEHVLKKFLADKLQEMLNNG